MPEFDGDGPEERLAQEAEELMRQRRFLDAVSRYQDLRRQSPTDLWVTLGYVSALECAGEVVEAERTLEAVAQDHRRSAALHRFRHLFFVRREDMRRAQSSRTVVQDLADDGPADQLADLYFNQGRYHEALAEFERLSHDVDLEESGLRAGVLARSGACQRQLGQFDEARERLSAALTLEPGNHWTLAELAECERALGNITAARRRYTEALDANGDDHWTRGHLAQLEFEDGHPERAVALYEKIIASDAKAVWAKVELAQVLTETDAERSTALCRAALDIDPAYPWALAHLGHLARRAGKLDEARKHYQDAATASPNANWILHELADTCRRLGRREEAYTHLEHAQRLNPYDAVTHGYLADFLRQDNRSREAMAHLEKAVQLDGGYAWAWRELAELRALDGRHEDADAACNEAEELEPGAAVNDGLKAFLLRCRGDRAGAAGFLERAVVTQQDYLWAWRELIDWYLADGQQVRAEQTARAALKHLPDNAYLVAMLGEALRRQGKTVEASALLGKAIAAGSEHPQIWAIQGQIAANAGDLATATKLIHRANELEPGIEHQALLAQLLIARDDLDGAAPLVRALLADGRSIQPAFELGAVLAERRGHVDEAIACCVRGLIAFPGDPRLTIRRARLLFTRDGRIDSETLAPLIALTAQPARPGIPWRDLAQLLAQNGQGMAARLAGAHLLVEAAGDRGDEARAWLTLAEIELGLDNIAAASQALEQSLARDQGIITGQLIGAVLAEQRGDKERAASYLSELERLTAAEIARGEDAERFQQLDQQVAGLWERIGRYDAARAAWRRLADAHPAALDLHAERASFLLRRGFDSEAEAVAERLLPVAAAEGEIAGAECQRLLRDLAVRRAARDDAGRAVELLLTYDRHLEPLTRLLLAQVALVADDVELCERQLDALGAEERRPAQLLRVRLWSAQRRHAEAETLARTLWDAEHDQESATLLAETIANQGRYAEALALAEHADLPATPSPERGLIAALLALELEGESACLIRLGRVRPDHRPGLVRILAAAWPIAWGGRIQAAVEPEDVLTVPPYPRATLRLAEALERAGHALVAGRLLDTMAQHLAERDASQSRIMAAAAVAPLCRAGRRRRAWHLAWTSGSWSARLRWLRTW